MESSAIKSIIALVVVLLAAVGMLIKFDKLPGVHLQAGSAAVGGSGGGGAGGADEGDDSAELARTEALRLGGLSRARNRRLAILNNQTLGEGEGVTIDFRGQKRAVHCEQILSNSVIVSCEGMPGTFELFLRGRRTDIVWQGGKGGGRASGQLAGKVPDARVSNNPGVVAALTNHLNQVSVASNQFHAVAVLAGSLTNEVSVTPH